ncbi:MAG TPA: hypothetical protein VLW53_18280 [Candidatus Eisenbacteria bacterium]|nr:hypothetical protein [Candidatus Eisenbacteria bacterium]
MTASGPEVSSRRRPLAALFLAAVAYALAAWLVAPGFYDGIAPPQPYRWVSPPPQFRTSNQQPLSGHATVKVAANGVVDPGSVFTQDGQAALSFVPGTFQAPADRSPVAIDVQPKATFPDSGRMQLVTNVYCITSSSPVVPGKDPLVALQFSSQVAQPADVYGYQGDGPWRKIGNTGSAAPYYIAARITALGCFAAGSERSAPAPSPSGPSQALPIAAVLAVAVVLLAGIPLLVLRRRGTEVD